jgi:hypothetical protein
MQALESGIGLPAKYILPSAQNTLKFLILPSPFAKYFLK